MKLEIIKGHFVLDVYGCSGTAVGKDCVGMAFKLSDQMWKTVKSNNLKNKGRNVWIYEERESVFAGVELEQSHSQHLGLEYKKIELHHYAYYKHVGPYNLIKKSGAEMRDELGSKNMKIISPYIEIYGHWNNDENKLETELFMALD